MRRDFELIKYILTELEKSELPLGSSISLQPEGCTNEELQYHLRLLFNEGLIEAIDESSNDGIGYIPQSLTYAGHDFLDLARDNGIWEKMKSQAGKSLKGIAVTAAQAAISTIISAKLS